MSELVLGIHRKELHNTDLGVIPFNFNNVNSKAYAWLPRDIADSKTEHAAVADNIGFAFPQILGYFQLKEGDKYLAYQRKGKEEGLFGQWSIGIGGHVSHEDWHDVALHTDDIYPPISTLVYAGALRELEEELGIDPRMFDSLNSIDDFILNTTSVIQSYANATSSRHVGLPLTLDMTPFGETMQLNLDPAEFCNIKWVTVEQLKADYAQYEDWSKWLINTL